MRNLVKEIITGRWLKKMSNLTVNTKEKFSIQQIAAIGVMTAVICVLAPFSLPIGPVPISLTNLAIYFALYMRLYNFAILSIFVTDNNLMVYHLDNLDIF